MDLIIVRHARPDREERGEGEGPADPPLSSLGRAQAMAVAAFLAAEHIDHIVASSMTRARQTAEPLAGLLDLDVELRDDLREVDQHRSVYIPAEEMTPDEPLAQEFMSDPLAIFDGDYWGFRDRVVAGFDEIIAANASKTVAVFCHGMVMSVYLQHVWGLSDPYRMQPDYTGIIRMQASSSKGYRTIKSINETAHTRDIRIG